VTAILKNRQAAIANQFDDELESGPRLSTATAHRPVLGRDSLKAC